MKYSVLPILIMMLTVAVAAQESSVPVFKPISKIVTIYDDKKDETTVKLDEMRIFESDSETLSMIAVGTFKGKKQADTPSELLFIFYATSEQRRYQVEPEMTISADGEVIRTRQMKNYGSQNKNEQIIEPLMNMIPYETVVKMANAKKVSLKIGTSVYDLTENNLKALREVANRLAP